jgi:hypothetical protein
MTLSINVTQHDTLYAIMLSVVMLSVVMLNVMATSVCDPSPIFASKVKEYPSLTPYSIPWTVFTTVYFL